MAETISIEQIVETAVSRILENHIPSLREALIRSVSEELLPELAKLQRGVAGSASGSHGGGAEDLLTALSAIHSGTTQKEILRALLANTARYSRRGALFVIKSGMATGWQGRGFEDSEAIKDFSLDLRSGIAARAMQTHAPCDGTAADMDARFVTHFRAPADGQVLLLPLLLKDKVAALVYADAGTDSGAAIDVASLQLVVAATGAWLEVVSLRKQTQKEGAPEIAEKPELGLSPVAAGSPVADPFAAHSPMHASAPAPQQSAAAAAKGETVAEPAPKAMAVSAPDSSTSTASSTHAPTLSVQDQDTHHKAHRFARLLMDEIKLYNQVKVIDGRKNSDLYDRLKEDIEKSRATYQKRYGSTVAADSDYFNQELVHNLADDDVSLLGVNYRH
jgi:hypothetical protein